MKSFNFQQVLLSPQQKNEQIMFLKDLAPEQNKSVKKLE